MIKIEYTTSLNTTITPRGHRILIEKALLAKAKASSAGKAVTINRIGQMIIITDRLTKIVTILD